MDSGSEIEVIIDEPIGKIPPDLYGHFTEHIGGGVYDGIWVGENSKIPNSNGIRKELVEYIRRLKPSVVRCPGGCFADSYNWRDGVGPHEERPVRSNFWINTEFLQKAPDGPVKYEPNHFGTQELVRFCRLIGAEPYIAANVRSLTARDFYEWIEYCNASTGSTALAQQKVTDGSENPFNVRFWGVGNESKGCGGRFTPEEYAAEYQRYVIWVPQFSNDLAYIAGDSIGADFEWTRGFFQKLMEQKKDTLVLFTGGDCIITVGLQAKGRQSILQMMIGMN